MVDCYGKWTAENDYNAYPKNKWCDCDYVANWVRGLGYQPLTTIENLVWMVLSYYDNYLIDNDVNFYTDIKESENDWMISIRDVSCFVEENGGLREFDYWC